MSETHLLKFTFECVEVSQCQDFDDYIDVPSYTNWSRGNVCHQNSGRATSNKHKSIAQWTERCRDQLKKSHIWIHRIHASRSLSIRVAICRSRAAPPRNASKSARNS
jgi:hypothetical protein